MNTPTHLIVSYALLEGQAATKKEKWSTIIGAFIPDAVIYFLFFYALVVGIPQRELWGSVYFQPGWQLAIDVFNSFPIFLAIAVVGYLIKRRWVILFAISACIHFVLDFFTHADDAHRHFLPISDFKFESPVSYWDPNYLGTLGSAIEIIILLVAVWWLWGRVQKKWSKILLLGYLAVAIGAFFFFSFIFSF